MNIFEARLRHEDFCRRLDMPSEEMEEAWTLSMEVKDVKYPPGPTPEEELSLIRLGKIISRRLKI